MIWMNCLLDGREHAVADEQVCAGVESGRFLAVCGRRVAPGSLACPPGRRCPTCHATLSPTRVSPTSRWKSLVRRRSP
jgi:hypothetical protein